jgi:hypothetical protein
MGRRIALTDVFGVTRPSQLPCLPLRLHVAQKLHGMTLPPRPGKLNERFRDLMDLLLMDAMITHDYAALREPASWSSATETLIRGRPISRPCRRIGRSRSHAWPKNWAEQADGAIEAGPTC